MLQFSALKVMNTKPCMFLEIPLTCHALFRKGSGATGPYLYMGHIFMTGLLQHQIKITTYFG